VSLLATQPVPKGPNVAILTNARSPGVLARAAVHAAGLNVVEPPIALDFRATVDDLAAAIRAALDDESVHTLMVIHAPPIASAYSPVAEIESAATGADKLVVAVMLGRDDGPLLRGSAIPAFSFPEPAAAVIGRMWAYSRWLQTEAEVTNTAPLEGVDPAAAHTVVRTAAESGTTVLGFEETMQLFGAYGLQMPAGAHTDGATAEEVAVVAETVGFPVVVKATKRRVGRSARAGISLDLGDGHAVVEAVGIIIDSLGDDARELVVQRMVQPGVDVHIHSGSDEMLGPVVTLDLGSLQSARNDDDAVARLAPVSAAAARSMIESSAVGKALEAAGLSDADLVDTIVRLGQLAADQADIGEIDIDPLIVSESGTCVTDAHVTVRASHPHELPLRRLA